MTMKTVISCSFRFLKELGTLISLFKSSGIEVLAPKSTDAVGNVDGFVVLASDQNHNPAELTRDFLYAIREADFHYLFLPDGRVGASVAAETCWAWHHSVPIIWSGRPASFSEDIPKQFYDFFTAYTYTRPDGILGLDEFLRRVRAGIITEQVFARVKKSRRGMFYEEPLILDLIDLIRA